MNSVAKFALLIGLLSLLSLALPRAAEADGLNVVAFASSGPNSGQCKDTFPTCSVAFPGASASASASFGSVEGAASTSPISGTNGDTSAEAGFVDTFTFLNATGGSTSFKVGFDTTGGLVSGAAATGEFAELDVKMTLQDTVVSSNKAFAEYVLDIEGGTFTTSGSPLDVLSLDVPDGDPVNLSLQMSVEAFAFGGDSASAVDPTGVFVTASNSYTAASGTVYPSASPVSTPEPSSMLLLGTGLLGVFGAIRRKRLA